MHSHSDSQTSVVLCFSSWKWATYYALLSSLDVKISQLLHVCTIIVLGTVPVQVTINSVPPWEPSPWHHGSTETVTTDNPAHPHSIWKPCYRDCTILQTLHHSTGATAQEAGFYQYYEGRSYWRETQDHHILWTSSQERSTSSLRWLFHMCWNRKVHIHEYSGTVKLDISKK